MNDREADKAVLASMFQYGADLSKPAHIIHYLYFRSQLDAERAAEALRREQFVNVRVDRAPGQSFIQRLFGGTKCSCIAEITAIPSEANVFATSDRMNALAKMFLGSYDGWEAAIVK